MSAPSGYSVKFYDSSLILQELGDAAGVVDVSNHVVSTASARELFIDSGLAPLETLYFDVSFGNVVFNLTGDSATDDPASVTLETNTSGNFASLLLGDGAGGQVTNWLKKSQYNFNLVATQGSHVSTLEYMVRVSPDASNVLTVVQTPSDSVTVDANHFGLLTTQPSYSTNLTEEVANAHLAYTKLGNGTTGVSNDNEFMTIDSSGNITITNAVNPVDADLKTPSEYNFSVRASVAGIPDAMWSGGANAHTVYPSVKNSVGGGFVDISINIPINDASGLLLTTADRADLSNNLAVATSFASQALADDTSGDTLLVSGIHSTYDASFILLGADAHQFRIVEVAQTTPKDISTNITGPLPAGTEVGIAFGTDPKGSSFFVLDQSQNTYDLKIQGATPNLVDSSLNTVILPITINVAGDTTAPNLVFYSAATHDIDVSMSETGDVAYGASGELNMVGAGTGVIDVTLVSSKTSTVNPYAIGQVKIANRRTGSLNDAGQLNSDPTDAVDLSLNMSTFSAADISSNSPANEFTLTRNTIVGYADTGSTFATSDITLTTNTVAHFGGSGATSGVVKSFNLVATDPSGNSTTYRINVTIKDDEIPVMSVNSEQVGNEVGTSSQFFTNSTTIPFTADVTPNALESYTRTPADADGFAVGDIQLFAFDYADSSNLDASGAELDLTTLIASGTNTAGSTILATDFAQTSGDSKKHTFNLSVDPGVQTDASAVQVVVKIAAGAFKDDADNDNNEVLYSFRFDGKNDLLGFTTDFATRNGTTVGSETNADGTTTGVTAEDDIIPTGHIYTPQADHISLAGGQTPAGVTMVPSQIKPVLDKSYFITYHVTDAAGNIRSITRKLTSKTQLAAGEKYTYRASTETNTELDASGHVWIAANATVGVGADAATNVAGKDSGRGEPSISVTNPANFYKVDKTTDASGVAVVWSDGLLDRNNGRLDTSVDIVNKYDGAVVVQTLEAGSPSDLSGSTLYGAGPSGVPDIGVAGLYTFRFAYNDPVYGPITAVLRSFHIIGGAVVFTLSALNAEATTLTSYSLLQAPTAGVDVYGIADTSMNLYHVMDISADVATWNDIFYISPEDEITGGIAASTTLAHKDVFRDEDIKFKTVSSNLTTELEGVLYETVTMNTDFTHKLVQDVGPHTLADTCTKTWSKAIFNGTEHLENVFANTTQVKTEIEDFLNVAGENDISGSLLAGLRTSLDGGDNLANDLSGNNRTLANLGRQLMFQLHSAIESDASGSWFRLTGAPGGMFYDAQNPPIDLDFVDPDTRVTSSRKFYPFKFQHGDVLEIGVTIAHPAVTAANYIAQGVSAQPPNINTKIRITMNDNSPTVT